MNCVHDLPPGQCGICDTTPRPNHLLARRFVQKTFGVKHEPEQHEPIVVPLPTTERFAPHGERKRALPPRRSVPAWGVMQETEYAARHAA